MGHIYNERRCAPKPSLRGAMNLLGKLHAIIDAAHAALRTLDAILDKILTYTGDETDVNNPPKAS